MSLTDLQPQLLGKIVSLCAADFTHGRAALLGLSVMNKQIRAATEPRLFERIFFRDHMYSRGDEILHSIRLFMATPRLRHYARTFSLCLARVRCLGPDHANYSDPYHYLLVPEMMEALVAMPEVKELSIRTEGGHGLISLQGLQAVARWGVAGQQPNIRSLTVSCGYQPEESPCEYWGFGSCEAVHAVLGELDFLEVFPQLETFCSFGHSEYPADSNLLETTGNSPHSSISFHPTIASNLKHLTLYNTCSNPRCGFGGADWDDRSISYIDFAKVTPQLQHLSLLGELSGFQVSRILYTLPEIPHLKYLDITDEQAPYVNRNRTPQDRPLIADKTFKLHAQLRRIVFVRKRVGEVYLRGYWLPVADSTGYISEDVNAADLAEIPDVWCHGVPQTGLTSCPSFTPWKGWIPYDERSLHGGGVV